MDEKNKDLRKLVEGEKQELNTKVRDKVLEEIEKTLNQAIAAKQRAEKERDEFKNSLTERDMLFVELDYQYGIIREEIKDV